MDGSEDEDEDGEGEYTEDEEGEGGVDRTTEGGLGNNDEGDTSAAFSYSYSSDSYPPMTGAAIRSRILPL